MGGHGWQGAYMIGAHTGRGGMCGRGACVVGGMHDRRATCVTGCAWWRSCMEGGVHGGGDAWQGAYIAGGHEWWGMGVRENGNCSRRYASYWDAFL